MSDSLLLDEAWKSERILNRFRIGIWSVLSVAPVVASKIQGSPLPIPAWIGMSWAVAAVVLHFTWLRQKHHPLLPFILTTADIVVLAFIFDALHVHLAKIDPSEAGHELYAAASGFMLILATNALRFSWPLATWSTACAAIAYACLLHRHQADHAVTTLVEILQFSCCGALIMYTTRKLKTIVRRTKERDALARFLPSPIIQRISENPGALSLGGQEQEATVLFADLRDFTELSDRLKPSEVVALLNEYFGEMVEEIFHWDGILDKFIGDGICAVFSPSLGPANHARRAVSCALGMQQRLLRINEARQARGEPPLKIGIGVHSGRVVAGNIGSPLRMEYTHCYQVNFWPPRI
jgi:adenylate cyclase